MSARPALAEAGVMRLPRPLPSTHIAAGVALALVGYVSSQLATPSPVSAALPVCSLYASNSGADSNNGSAAAPFATVTKLISSLAPGQTGCLAPGATFVGDVSIHRGGVSGAPITIMSVDPSHPATIKGRLTTFPGGDWLTFTQLMLDGVNSSNLPSPTIGSEHVTFSHDDVTNEHTAICFDLINSSEWGVARYTTIDSSRIHDCGRLPYGSTNNDHGIYVSGFNTSITNNFIYNNADRGVQLRGAQGTLVEHNVIDSNGEGVLFGDLSASGNEVAFNVITNSIVRSNVEAWWGDEPVGTGNTADDNCVWATNANTYYDTNGGIIASGGGFTETNDRVADPMYVAAGSRNYYLQSASPCAGFGVETGVVPGVSGPAATTSGTTAPPPTTTTSTTAATSTTSTTAATTTSATTTTTTTPSTTTTSVTTTATTTTSTSSPTTTSSLSPPTNTTAPSIVGTTRVGSTLTAQPGSWSGAPTFQFAWLRCSPSGTSCSPISGATGSTYTATTDDRNRRLEVTVTARNAAGSRAATSGPSGMIKS